MLYFFLFIAWIYLLVMTASDIFRSDDLGNWAKALWILFLVILPIMDPWRTSSSGGTRWLSGNGVR